MHWQAADYTIVDGMVGGSIRSLEPFEYFLFAESGLAHLLAASGSHLLVVAFLANGLIMVPGALLRRSGLLSSSDCLEHPAMRASVIATAAILFAWATDFSKPILRALLALLLVLLAQVRGARIHSFSALFVGALAAFFWGRGGLVSLALSVAAILGILSPPRFLRRRSLWIRLALGPWLATFPLTAFCFHQGSLGSPLYNLLFAGLWSFVTLPLGLLAKLSAVFFPDFAGVLDQAAAATAHILCAGQRLLLLRLPSAVTLPLSGWLLVSGAGWLVWICFRRQRSFFCTAWIAIYFIYHLLWPQAMGLCLNVGQGEAIALRSERDAPVFLVDVGPGWRGPIGGPIGSALAREGIGQVSGVLLTHFDADHSGGLKAVLSRYGKKELSLWISCSSLSRKKGLEAIRLAERFQIQPRCIGTKPIEIYPGLICVHLPVRPESNGDSPLCRFERQKRSIAMAGDSDAKTEEIYSRIYPEMVRADIWKASHHGSRHSSADFFLETLTSRRVWISAGINNFYGHPHQATLQRLNTHGFWIQRTDRDGTLALYPP